MKIWYVSKYAETSLNSNASRQYMLSKAFVKEGGDVSLIYSRSNGKWHNSYFSFYKCFTHEGVNCVEINGPLLKSLGVSFLRIFSWFLFELNFSIYLITRSVKHRPDIVIVSSLSLLSFFTVGVLKKIFKYKMVVEVRDIWPDTIIEMKKVSEKNIDIKFLRWIENYGYQKADLFFSPIPLLDVYLRTKLKKPFKFICITQGFDNETVFKSTCRYEMSFNSEYFNVCYAGSIGAVNYIDELLSAANLLRDKKIRFIILGEGPEKRKLIEKYKDNKNIIFLNAVSREEVIPIISKADLLVNLWGKLNIYQYGVSPNKWIDYMLSGCPILVAYNGYRSMINEADCGFFVEANRPDILAETILNISQMDKAELTIMGLNGRKWVLDNCNYKDLGSKLWKFIQEETN